MDRFESAQGTQIQMLIAHRQVTSLGQCQTKMTRQIRMLKIGFVVRPRCEQRNMRIITRRALAFEGVDQLTIHIG